MKKFTALLAAAAMSASMFSGMTAFADSPAIIRAYTDGGNTVAEFDGADGKLAIAASYKDGGALEGIKYATVENGTVTFNGIEADKILLWDSLNGMKPQCPAEDVESAEPTGTPDTTETDTPTTSPDVTETDAPTTSPDVTETDVPTTSPDVTVTDAPTTSPDVTVTTNPTGEYKVSIGTVTGGEAGDVMLVKTAAEKAPTPTPEPVVTTFSPITEEYTFISENFANGAAIPANKYLDGGKVYSEKGNPYNNKGTSTINGTDYMNCIRVKGSQDTLAIQLGVPSTVIVYSNDESSRRYVSLGTTMGAYDIAFDTGAV